MSTDFGETSLNSIQKSRLGLVAGIATLACSLYASTPAPAQDPAKPASATVATEENGIYAVMGKDFAERCNSGDFSVELGEKKVTGDE